MGWVRRRWQMVLYAAIIVYYLVGRLLDVDWMLELGMLLFVVIGGGWIAMGRVWDARRDDAGVAPPDR